MNQEQPIGIIRPEIVASKLAAIRNYEYPKLLEQITARPRLVELLWFIQYMSIQPGGLGKFCADMIEALPHRFRTPAMLQAKRPLSRQAKLKICGEIPDRYLDATSFGLRFQDNLSDLVEWMAEDDSDCRTTPEDRKTVEKALTIEAFERLCRASASEILPGYLQALCTHKDKGFLTEHRSGVFGDELWFIDDPIAAVFEMMERHAAQVEKRIASTAVTQKVFDALNYALQERAMVRVEGDSRFGKTESVRAWCDIRPGLARLVSVPCSNSVSDLHRRIAEAIGMDVSYGSRKQGVRERLEFVLRHSALFIVLDEGAFLVPQNYTADTPPARLNWVRTEIVDRGLPLAVVVTPQTFGPQVSKFVKKTGYAMEQFFGRNHRAVILPAELSQEDMIAVAKIHFPEMGEDYLALIADLASLSENYLQAVEAIAKLARYFARRDRHPRVTAADIESAASEVIPRRPQAAKAKSESTEPLIGERSKGSHGSDLKPHLRAVKPGSNRRGSESDLSVCSLRGDGSERVNADLVSADS